jgi:hypothetical protein
MWQSEVFHSSSLDIHVLSHLRQLDKECREIFPADGVEELIKVCCDSSETDSLFDILAAVALIQGICCVYIHELFFL